MVIHPLIEDRMLLVHFLEAAMKQQAVYSGAPLFLYQVGSCTIMRDGDIVTEGLSHRLLQKMEAACLVGASYKARERDIVVPISSASGSGRTIPVQEPSGSGYANLVRIIHARSGLMNQAAGTSGSFHVKRTAMKTIQSYAPKSFDEFREALAHGGGFRAVKGVSLFQDFIVFTGFPGTVEKDYRNAFRVLAERIVSAAFTKRWTTPFSKSENRKERFRIWLHSLGLSGNDYASVRQILLKNFEETH